MESAKYKIPFDNLPKAVAKIATINKKALKNGLSPMSIEYGETFITEEEMFTRDYTRKVKVDWVEISIKGTFPVIDGWRCFASIEHEDGVNLINVHGDKDVSKWRAIDEPVCEHCHTKRIRKYSYLIENLKTGDIKQVGKSCLKDFLKKDPDTMLNYLAWFDGFIREFEEGGEYWGGRPVPKYDILDVAEIAAMAVREWGFTPSRDIGSTKDAIVEWLNDPKSQREFPITENDKVVAKRTLDSFGEAGVFSNFEKMMEDLITVKIITTKYFGYVAGAVFGNIKKTEKAASQAMDALNYKNEHIGTVKERTEFDVKLEATRVIHGDYGATTIHDFVTTDNHKLVWFCSGKGLLEAGLTEIGEEITIVGTVKGHGEFNGLKNTVINRVKMV